MTANLLYLLNDSSTYANFSSWAGQVSNQLALAGWVQSTDTGQVMWTGMNLSAVSMSGSNATYTYSGLTGFQLQNGRAMTITGMTNSVNNGVFVITAFTGTTSGTFTVVNASGTNESGSTGHVTAQSTVPTTNSFVYEIWQPNDGLTNFYLKMEYGNFTGNANQPEMCATLGTLTNGAGTLVGLQTSRMTGAIATNNAASSTVPFECRFSGGAGYFGALMWKGTNNGEMVYVERSVNSSGAYISNHVTLVVIGCTTTGATNVAAQQTLSLTGLGPAPLVCSQTTANYNQGLLIRMPNGRNSLAFNSSIPVDNLAPCVGYFDYPLLGLAGMNFLAVSEGQTITVSVYGSNHTYYCTQTFPFACAPQGSGNNAGNTLLMRYE